MSGDFHLAVALISLSAWQCYATRLGAVQLLFLEVQLPQEIGSIHWLNTPTTDPLPSFSHINKPQSQACFVPQKSLYLILWVDSGLYQLDSVPATQFSQDGWHCQALKEIISHLSIHTSGISLGFGLMMPRYCCPHYCCS